MQEQDSQLLFTNAAVLCFAQHPQKFYLESYITVIRYQSYDRFSIIDRGYVREGYWADLVLVDLEGSFIARDEDVISSSGWTIFNGNEFRSSITTTIINGVVVWNHGELQESPASGKPLEFSYVS